MGAGDGAVFSIGVSQELSRPASWISGAPNSLTNSETMNRTVEGMKSMSAEATELSKRQQDLSRLRTELVARGDTTGQ